ncbi:MAG: NUDIX domain-containing protein [Clostridia bacterium]|nr:NUDIX domain-containing protein [Clostridia bacterium]
MKYEKSCGAVVYKFESENRLYLIEHMALGHISLPKGHVEDGETEAETALREIREETNLEAELDTNFRKTITYSPFEGITKDVVFFTAKAKEGALINQESEVSGLEWLSFEDAMNILTYDTDKEVLTAAHEYLNG